MYEDIIKELKLKWNRRLAWFVRLYYLENKDREEIMEILYINTEWWYYSMKTRARKYIQETIENQKNCLKSSK